MLVWIVVLILLVVFKELEEHSKDGKWKPRLHRLGEKSKYNQFVRNWLNTPTAWKNKHKNKWLKGPLVFLADGEHFFQHLMYWCVAILCIPILLHYDASGWWFLIVRVGLAVVSGIMNEKVLK